MSQSAFSFRTIGCGQITAAHDGQHVRVTGWVVTVRDLGKIVFASVSDATGALQLVTRDPARMETLRTVPRGGLLTVGGTVRHRGAANVRADQTTGEVELDLGDVHVHEQTPALPTVSQPRDQLRRLIEAVRAVLSDRGEECYAAAPVLWRETALRTGCAAQLGPTWLPAPLSPTGQRETWLAQVETAFLSRAEYAGIVTAIVSAVGAVVGTEAQFSAYVGPLDRLAGLVVTTPLPVSGLPSLAGEDLPLVAGAARDVGTDTCAAVLLTWQGRVMGLGAYRGKTPAAGGAVEADDDAVRSATTTRYQRVASRSAPGSGWFVLDLQAISGPEAGDDYGPYRAGTAVRALLRAAGGGRDTARMLPEDLQALARRTEESDIAATAAMAISRTASGDVASSAEQDGFAAASDDFSITPELVDRVVELFPQCKRELADYPNVRRFSWLWSVLESQSVRELLYGDDTWAALNRAVQSGVLTEAGRLTCLDRTALLQLDALLESACEPAAMVALKRVLASAPGAFTPLLSTLSTSRRVPAQQSWPDLFVELASTWVCAPGLFDIAIAGRASGVTADQVGMAARRAAQPVLRNLPVESGSLASRLAREVGALAPGLAAVASAVDARTLTHAMLHQTFRPIALTWSELVATVARGDGCRDHISRVGLRVGGAHADRERDGWDFASAGGFTAYLSKNAASRLAKGTVGICTASDHELFERPDHYHLNIADDRGVVIGNAQLHVMVRDGQRLLLVRAINATTSALTRIAPAVLTDGVLSAVVELAIASDIAAVHLGEPGCFWHLDSSRPALRARLQQLRDMLKEDAISPPLFLYWFGPARVSIARSWTLWSRASTGAPVDEILEFAP
jgi:OB-fold nucleic acid binding domain